ncbi:MAG: hypothetical protein K6E50_01245 [Lachnospiraceae bacterium]|nr:hypothetical protein [Lachnospiraceae bacterium]
MATRVPLEAGAVILDRYVVKRLIAEGGFSLIYEAETENGTVPAVIKEYFPAMGAVRDEDGRVCAAKGCEDLFERNKRQFLNEGIIGGKVAESSFQALSFSECGDGYAVMRRRSDDMISLTELQESWKERTPLPRSGKEEDRDPVFSDLARVDYALRVTESLLTALIAVHERGYLHLDISSNNVIWAGMERSSGRNCVAFLADYGCAVPMKDGKYVTDWKMNYSPGFAAPEMQREGETLTVATDLCSVGKILFYLCVGDAVFEKTRNVERQVERETDCLNLPRRILDGLREILVKSQMTEKEERYQSAAEMMEKVRELTAKIPEHPINPDDTRSFTLYSLKSMLEGSREKGYGWADELSDRRGVPLKEKTDILRERVSTIHFESDEKFLKFVLPEEVFRYLNERIAESADKRRVITSIMSGNYDKDWKSEICLIMTDHGTRRLLKICGTLLNHENEFFADARVMFELLGEEGKHLRACVQRCDPIRNPHIELAMFTVFALLGPEEFKHFIRSERDAEDMFPVD